MIITKYSNYIESIQLPDNFGEYVENVCEEDEHIRYFVNGKLADFDQTLTIANAVELLSMEDKIEIKNRINHHKNVSGYRISPDLDFPPCPLAPGHTASYLVPGWAGSAAGRQAPGRALRAGHLAPHRAPLGTMLR
jgi:hypothetical protein